MKKLFAVLIVFFSLTTGVLAQGITSNTVLIVYYFHATNRCHTCTEIEKQVSETMRSKFAHQIKSTVIVFESIDYESSENKQLVDKYQAWGPTLLLVKLGEIDVKNDLTNMAFKYALNNPEKMQEELAKEIAKMILKL